MVNRELPTERYKNGIRISSASSKLSQNSRNFSMTYVEQERPVHVTDLSFFVQMSIMVEQQSDVIDNIETAAASVEKDMETGYAIHPSLCSTVSNVYALELATRTKPLSLLVAQEKSGGSASSLHSSSLPSSPSFSRLLLLTIRRSRPVARFSSFVFVSGL